MNIKLPKRQKTNEGEDIIGKLPESLITHILNFLATKDAVRTSVLSKKWMHRWTSITKLDLNDRRKKGGKQNFVNFVNRSLLLTKSSSIESFSLVMANKYDASLVNTWISGILNWRVKYLRIDSDFEFSFSALTCYSLFDTPYSLEELVLEMCCCAITIPSTFLYFGNLKLLKLSGITFNFDSSRDLITLAVLKKFETINCIWLSANKVVTFKAPLLESVFIEQDHKSVSHEPRSCEIMFSAKHLKEFTYCGYGISQPITLSDPSPACNASANIILDQYCVNRVPECTGSCALLLLKQFSQVKYLKFVSSVFLYWSVIQVLTKQKVAGLPVFGKLSHLELNLVTGEVLLGLLLKSPVLKTLVFKGISKFDQELLSSATVPKCLESTLQIVKFEKVHGSEHELCLAKFVMENGLVLKRMSFSLAGYRLGKSKVMEEFKEKLFSFKKGFSFAIVEFTYD
ncbi:F-box-like domain superfamily [Sesbania bispinosa]|nr:F-box-like domain superfamily [Sesbania bispinosa]